MILLFESWVVILGCHFCTFRINKTQLVCSILSNRYMIVWMFRCYSCSVSRIRPISAYLVVMRLHFFEKRLWYGVVATATFAFSALKLVQRVHLVNREFAQSNRSNLVTPHLHKVWVRHLVGGGIAIVVIFVPPIDHLAIGRGTLIEW